MRFCLLTSSPSACIQLVYFVQTRGLRFDDVVCVGDGGEAFAILKEYAQINGFGLHFVDDPNGPACETLLRDLAPDVVQILTGTIIRRNILAIPRIGTINTHAGMLPEYPGIDSPYWAVLEDGRLGVCVHFVTEGVDDGAVVASREQGLLPGDTLGSVLHRNHHENKWQVTAEAMAKLRDGQRDFTPPDLSCYRQYFTMHRKLVELARAKLRAMAREGAAQ